MEKAIIVFGNLLALQAELEGMKWDNQVRVLEGFTDHNQFNYSQSDFDRKAQEIRDATNELFK